MDLDETLVHSTFDQMQSPDVKIPIKLEDNTYDINVLIRPGTIEFLKEMGKLYEIVIFTASMSKYADPLITILDTTKVVEHRLFREHCTYIDGTFVKDLNRLGRTLRNVLLVDNSPVCFSLQQENGIPIKSWYDDKYDVELYNFIPTLSCLAYCSDVRTIVPFMIEDGHINHSLVLKNYGHLIKKFQEKESNNKNKPTESAYFSHLLMISDEISLRFKKQMI